MSEVLDKVPHRPWDQSGSSGPVEYAPAGMPAHAGSEEWQAVSGLETGLHLDHGEVASLHGQAQQWAPRSQHRCTIVYFRVPRGIFRFPGFGFEPCGSVLLCKTFHALPLALSGANEYH
jgi:hypothetical protein